MVDAALSSITEIKCSSKGRIDTLCHVFGDTNLIIYAPKVDVLLDHPGNFSDHLPPDEIRQTLPIALRPAKKPMNMFGAAMTGVAYSRFDHLSLKHGNSVEGVLAALSEFTIPTPSRGIPDFPEYVVGSLGVPVDVWIGSLVAVGVLPFPFALFLVGRVRREIDRHPNVHPAALEPGVTLRPQHRSCRFRPQNFTFPSTWDARVMPHAARTISGTGKRQ